MRAVLQGGRKVITRGALLAGVLLGVVVGGCASGLVGSSEPKPGQDEATRIGWHDTYGMDLADMPEILWVEGADLTCGGPTANGFTGWIDADSGQCAGGKTLTHDELGIGLQRPIIQLAWTAGNTKFSPDSWTPSTVDNTHGTGLDHELCHAMLYLTGRADNDHLSDCFAVGGPMDRAIAATRAVGR